MGYIPTPAFTPVSGVSIQDNNSSGVTLEELSTTGGVTIADLGTAGVSGGLFLNSSLAIKLSGTGVGSWLFTGANLAGLATPAAGQTPAVGLTQDGKLYRYPTGGPWNLLASGLSSSAPLTDALVPLAGATGLGADAGHQHVGKLPISSLTEFGHSWLAGITAGLPKSALGRGDIGSQFAAMVGVIEGNLLNLAIGGTLLTKRLNGGGSLFGGWLGALQFVYPDGARVIAEDSWTDQTTSFTSPVGPSLIVHGINDLTANLPEMVFQPSPASGATVGPGSYPYTYGLQAWFNAMVTVISRLRACQWYGGYEVANTLTNDATTAFGGSGSWAKNAGVNLNSGAFYNSNATPGGTFTITLPTSFQGGVVAVNLIGQPGAYGLNTTAMTASTPSTITLTGNDTFPAGVNFVLQIDNEQILANASGTTVTIVTRGVNGTTAATHTGSNNPVFIPQTASVAWTGTASGVSGTPATFVTGSAAFGDYCSTTTRFTCTAADAGKTIIGTTQNLVTGDTATSFWYDSWWVESKVPAPVIVTDEPRANLVGNSVTPTFTTVTAMNAATAAAIALFDSAVQRANLDSLVYNRGFLLTGSINNSTTTGIAITSVTNAVPFVGQRLMVFAAGDASEEDWLITAVSGSAGSYTISVTRGYNSTSAVAHAAGANITDGQIWYIDNLHPNSYGASILAGQIHLAMQTALENASVPNYQVPAGHKGVWIKYNDFAHLGGVQDNSYIFPPAASTSAIALVQNTMQAFPFFVPRHCLLVGFAYDVTTLAASSSLRVGLYMTETDGITPSALLHDLGTAPTTAGGGQTATGRYKRLNPGLYYVATVAQGGAPSLQCLGSSASGGPFGLTFPAIPLAGGTNAALHQPQGYSSGTTVSGAFPTTFGTPTVVTTGPMPIVGLLLRSKNWQ